MPALRPGRGPKNYDYSTDEYIRDNGKRTKVADMTDDHLDNAIEYLRWKWGSVKSDAQLAMERERTRRQQGKEMGYGEMMPAGLQYRIDDRIPPDQIYMMGPEGLAGITNLNYEGDNMATTPDTLFEVAILQETKNEDKTTTTELVYGPEPIVAKDTERAKLIAVQRAFAGDTKIDPANIRISVRLFGTFQ